MKFSIKSLVIRFNQCVDNIKSIHEDPLLRYFKDDNSHFDLAPAFIEVKDENGNDNPKYGPVKDIANKLGNRNVKNIALTGPYGAGKSSVLQTLMRDYRKANYLCISLATLEDDTLYKELVEKDKTTNEEANKQMVPAMKQKANNNQKTIDKDAINHLIEYSILQQIIYKEKAHKLRQSRLKRIQDIKWKKALPISASLIVAVIAAIVLFMPDFIMVDSLCEVFSCSEKWKQIWDVICMAYLIIISIYILSYIIVSTYNSKINKLNFKNGEIDIKENTSIFNKHLDEIIYFFEVTKYNVVIIEDLDRFDTNHIFLKLREINQLLNASNSIGRRIVFIYAVRDDIFHDTNRTKFFDYITTVIPVVNSSNACDKLISALQEKGVNEITETTCKELGFYIDDMRILYNIVDEYLQYRSKIGEKISPKNLLGMIVYKNYFPKDFADLHNRKGVVYSIVSNKQKYVAEITESSQKKIVDLKTQLNEIVVKNRIDNGKDLRTLYVMEYLKKKPRIYRFITKKGEKMLPQELINDENKFKKLINDEFNQYEYYYYYSNLTTDTLDIKFSDVEKVVDSEYSYTQRLNFESEVITQKRKEIEQLEMVISKYQQMSISELIRIPKAKSFHVDISKLDDKTKLVEFLLKEGYINEFYYDYISYFYPGTLMPEDKDFIADLRIGNKKEYTYQLCKFESVIEEIPARSYNNGGVLNVSLVKYMSDHVDNIDISSKLDKIIKYIVSKKEKEFVLTFYKTHADCSVLFERLFAKWTRFDVECLYEGKERDRSRFDIFFEMFLRYVNYDVIAKDNDDFDIHICDNFDWLNERIGIIGLKRIMNVIQKRNLKFYSLNAKTLSPDFMSYVIDGCYFERRRDNLLSIVAFLAPDKITSYRMASMTSIRGIGNTDVMDDMDNNMDEYIQCFPDSSIEETGENLLCIVNTCQVSDKTKEYLRKQVNKIKNLSDILNNERKIMSIETSVLKARWENIEDFVNEEDDNIKRDELVDYIEKNIDELCSVKATSVLSEAIKSKLFTYFVGTNVLSYSSYKKFRDSFDRIFTTYDLTGLESNRMSYLIDTNGIKFNEYYYKFICEKYPQLTSTFIINNKTDYLKNVSLYPLSSDIAEGLVKSSSLKKEEKVQVVYSLPVDFNTSTSLANSICQLFVNGNLDRLKEKKDVFINYISASNNIELKVKAFMHYVEHQDINDAFIKEALNTMGAEYAEIAMQKGFRPKINKGHYNKELILYLLNRKFISTYKEEDKYYQINTRNLN